MRIDVERFDSGWIGLQFIMTKEESAKLRKLLLALESEEIGHFHTHSLDLDGEPGVVDVKFSLLGPDEMSNTAFG